jgi:hypothetical protein
MSDRLTSLVVFGNTGSGKSCLSNTLVGSDNAFKESKEVESETMETIGKHGVFDGQPTFIIDTPGLHDASGLDTPHLIAMTQYIKEHKDVKAFVIVINFLQVKLDDSVRRLFQLVCSMFPGQKWYHNLAVVWSNYWKFLPEEKKEQKTKREGFKRFIRKYIVPNITDDELNSIPQYFVDTKDARKENDESKEELKHLITWVSQLRTLQENLGEIQEVNAEIKSTEEEFKTQIISEETHLNIKTIITAEFKRTKSILYNGEITYSDWEEIPDSRNEKEEILPIEPVGESMIEKRTRQENTEPVKIVTGKKKIGSVRIFSHRPKVDTGYIEHITYFINEERICQPMNDGSIKFGEWEEKSRTEKRKRKYFP